MAKAKKKTSKSKKTSAPKSVSKIDRIEDKYVNQLRAIAPELQEWWASGCKKYGDREFAIRWPTGLAGHPRVIHIFRESYLDIEDLSTDEGRRYPHFEILVDEVIRKHPDLSTLLEGLVLVPMGLDDQNEVC